MTGFGRTVSLASAERLGRLSKLVDKNLKDIALEIKKGSIGAEPVWFSERNTSCTYCEFASACPFDPARDRMKRFKKLSDDDVWERIERGGEDRA